LEKNSPEKLICDFAKSISLSKMEAMKYIDKHTYEAFEKFAQLSKNKKYKQRNA
jgi:hypothetical protein